MSVLPCGVQYILLFQLVFQDFAVAGKTACDAKGNDATCTGTANEQQSDIVASNLLQAQKNTYMVLHQQEDEGAFGDENDKPGLHASANGTMVNLKVMTAAEDYAGTETGVNVSFMVGGAWTTEAQLLERIPIGGSIKLSMLLDSWPTQMRVRALGDDSWGVSSIELTAVHFGKKLENFTASIIKDHKAHYVAHNASIKLHLNDTAIFDVPAIPKEGCETRKGPGSTLVSMGSESPPGTKCIFGVDVRDRGAHCILELEYGTFGWCFTSKDKSSWGSCNEKCQLIGENRVLGEKIKEAAEQQLRMQKTIDAIADKVGVVPKGKGKSKGKGKAKSPTKGKSKPEVKGKAKGLDPLR